MTEIKLPETYKKVMAILSITTPLAALIIWVLWPQEVHFLWFVGAIVIFEICFGLLSLFFTKKIPLKTLERAEQHKDVTFGKISLAMAIVGIVAVFVGKDLYTKLICAVGVIFFGLGGIYLIKKNKTQRDRYD